LEFSPGGSTTLLYAGSMPTGGGFSKKLSEAVRKWRKFEGQWAAGYPFIATGKKFAVKIFCQWSKNTTSKDLG